MQITHFRTRAAHRHTRLVAREARMPATIVEYARFVEVQQRRAQILAELEPPREPPVPPTPDGQIIEISQSLTSVDANTTSGIVDVR